MQSQTRQASIECKYILVHSPTCGIQCKYIEESHHSIAFNAKMHFGVHIHTSLGGGRFSWKPILRTERRRTMRIYISGNDRREVHGDSHLRQEKGKRLSRRRTMADVGPWPMAVGLSHDDRSPRPLWAWISSSSISGTSRSSSKSPCRSRDRGLVAQRRAL